MMIELAKLAPNPFRNFRVDPYDMDNIEKLKDSIRENEFWGGVTCRQMPDGTYQIAAGHHRVEAAKAVGIEYEDIHVGNFSDEQMIRIYAVENATQRGNTSTAFGGSIASAVRFLAKVLLVGDTEKFFSKSGRPADASDLGREVIAKFLDGVPGINDGSVQVALKQIKSSGEYAAIIEEVRAEIEAETAAALKAAEAAKEAAEAAEENSRKAEVERKAAEEAAKEARTKAEQARAEHARQVAEAQAALAAKRQKEAEEQQAKFDAARQASSKASEKASKASEKAAEREVTFDRNGVAPYFSNPHHLRVFQARVESPGMKELLPVSRQVELAAALADLAKQQGKEMTGAFIELNIGILFQKAKQQERGWSKEDQRRAEREDLTLKARRFQADFARNVRGMTSTGFEIASLLKNWPKDLPFPITGEFRTALGDAKNVIDQLTNKV